MPRIAISYRRDDTGVITGRIFDRLVAHYGKNTIFRDIDNIPLGIDFRKHIAGVLERTDVLLVMIGSKWLGHRKGQRPRIGDESDALRIEIETALQRGISIIPVLIDNARMPKVTDLPPSLAEFAFRNAVKVDSLQDFDHHIDRLVRQMDRITSAIDPAVSNRTNGRSIQVGTSTETERLTKIATDEWSIRTPAHSADFTADITPDLAPPMPATPNPFLRFPRQLEIEFKRSYNANNAFVARIALVLGLTTYLAFYFWDKVLDDANSYKTLFVRLAMAGWAIGMLFLPKSFFSKYLQLIISVTVTLAGVGVVGIISIIQNGLNSGLSGVVLTLMFIFCFFRLLFIPSLISGLITWIAYNVVAIPRLPPEYTIANNFFLISAIAIGASVTYLLERLFRQEFLKGRELTSERARTNRLIENLLPTRIAERLKAGEQIIAESHGEATVLLSDLVGFTSLTTRLSPNHLIEVLNDIFSIFDELSERHGVEKIKTIGDAYVVASGLQNRQSNSAEAIANFSLDMTSAVRKYAESHQYPLNLRVGICTGQVISGVIGLRKRSFDIWGETVNVATRLRSQFDHGHILVSETTYWRLRENYNCEPRGSIDVEGGGQVQTYVLTGKKASAP